MTPIPETHLECRDFGHAWAPTSVHRDADANYLQGMSCRRCGTEKVRKFDQGGYLLGSSRYVYAEGYLVAA